MQDVLAPERTLAQRYRALDRANEVRVYRADLKRRIAAGETPLSDALADEMCATMRVVDLLLVVPKVGRVKADRVLRRAHISPSKRVRGLTDRQTRDMAVELGRFPAVDGGTIAACLA